MVDKKVESMKDAIDEILFHILKCLGVTYKGQSIRFSVRADGIKVIYDEYSSAFHERPDLCGIVRAYNYIVYGR